MKKFFRLLLFLINSINTYAFQSTILRKPSLCVTCREELKMVSDASEGGTMKVDLRLSDDKVTKLFAWVSRAFSGDRRYNDLMLAVAASFGMFPEGSPVKQLLDEALLNLPGENVCMGAPYNLKQRENASLGAMGAAQWMGAWKTRPHSLLDISEFSSVDDWIKTLPRGCKRTIQKKALKENFIVTTRPIIPSQPAPHSSLAHFRCVIEHQVRLLPDSPDDFVDGLSIGISRYIGTTQMVGEIQEYRDADTGKVLAFAHEVRKGNVIRGQWFYGTDEASNRYVWFHSVYELVRRAIDMEGIQIVDLGPSGSDSFSQLKAKYGFMSVDNWTEIADYTGPFMYYPEAQSSNWWQKINEII